MLRFMEKNQDKSQKVKSWKLEEMEMKSTQNS